ncbi:MAG: DNA recombination protein RmuC, partial [Ruthenibacterium sp.]
SSDASEQRLENIRATMETRITAMQGENAKKLDEMRQTVDEKLQKTLETKLQQSFARVSEQLESVYKGLGEMQTLATGVGDLKKVLSNVKTRGILGEIQLGAILEQILAPEQYAENVATVPGSSERVEYAVRLPGDGDTPVWLPVDAKFPIDAYSALLEAQEGTDKALADAAVRTLEQRVRGFAKDIHTKYIHVPDTTDFGIMFLPFEGLYAEVVRRGMMEKLQTEYKVIVAGPTTMAALLNSLQMGFRTLAIQKSSSEVWKVLGNVKSEFDMFGKVLTSAQSRINQANDELEKLVGVRTRQIQRRLSQVSNLSQPSDALSEDPDLLTETLLSSVI